ncbi:MAG: hypothetical protein JXB18_00610 [Sedimentisphaerales bacterium]|nr:hypothetical protein [Sedimentisphaerales bacterium]
MKSLVAIISCAVIMALMGCHGPAKAINDPNMQVILIGTNKLPSQFVGKWAADREGWEINIEKDGRISSIIHTIGRAPMKNGHTTTVDLVDNGKGTIRAGKWIVQYNEKTKELVVEINIEKFQFVKGQQVVQGSSQDFFIGSLSKDNQHWVAAWTSFPKYYVTTEGYNDYQLPSDEGSEDQGFIDFVKK